MDSRNPENPGYIANQADLLNRLGRAKGQIGGLERMVSEERYCIDILTQVSAVQAALDKVALGLLGDHARHCVIGARENDRDGRTTEMMDAVARLIRSR